jgi:hypothetical protein
MIVVIDRGSAFLSTPLWCPYSPVNMLDRLGQHEGVVT